MKKLKESEEKFHLLFNTIPDALYIIDQETGKILDVNKAAEKMYGYSRGEWLQMKNTDVSAEPDKTQKETYSLPSQIPIRYHKKKDGTIFPIEMMISSYTLNNRRLIIATGRDITERIKSEEELMKYHEHLEELVEERTKELKESEEKYRSLVEDSQEGVWALDENENTTFVNPRICEMLGYTKNEMMGKNLHLLIPDSMEERINGNRIRREKGIKETYDLELVKKDGTIIYTKIKAAPIMSKSRDYKGSFAYITDITSQKHAEDTLRESEELFRTIFETAKDCIFIKDRSLQYIRINKAMEEIFGVSSEDLLNKTDIELFGLEAGKHVMEIDQRVIQGEIIEEEPTKPINGIPHTFHTIKVPLKDTQGNIYGLCGIARDISNRKIFEQKLIESEEKFRTISEQSLMGILISQDDKYKYANQAVADIFGYTVEELLDTPQEAFMNYIHPEDREFVREQATKKQMGIEDVITNYPVRGITKAGETICVHLYSRSITFEGKPALLITILDFTERRKAQQNLEVSEEKYRALFENTPIGVTISDYEGHVIEINEYMKDLLGYELEEFQKLGVAAAYANDQDRIPFKNRLEEQGYIQDYEVDLKKKDGKVFPALLNSIKTNVSGGPIYINTIRDITEKKEIEEIKTHLLTRFSHEFKTPLISIKGFSDFLLSEYKNKLDEKTIGFLERIKEGANRLNLLINAFMQSSQLGEKLTTLNIEKENLSDLIKLGVSEMEGLIHIRKHTINMDIPKELIGKFDKEKIYTVITNLLMNAIKYTPLEGKIFIHSKIEEDNIFFSIKDSGIGLTEEDKRHLFKPFGKIERYGKGWDIVSEGMGVGLYLSKEIISLHGGKIWAESDGKSKGSTFYFSLPMTSN